MNLFDMLGLQQSQNRNRPPTQQKFKLKSKQQLVLNAFQTNLFRISAYLDRNSIANLKLTCRLFSYSFISQQIWEGMRLSVAQMKIEGYEDIDFVEQQPSKNLNKEDRKIRIHSLKKKATGEATKSREASNLKNKGKKISMFNQEALFRNTEIGFKRLIKPNINPTSTINSLRRPSDFNKNNKCSLVTEQSVSVYTNLLHMLEFPNKLTPTDLIIRVNDPWQTNMSRVSNLITVVKKWNQFHSKLKSHLTTKSNHNISLSKQLKSLKEFQQMVTEYSRIFQTTPSYKEILVSLQGAKNNLLIDETLNKIARKFLQNHQEVVQISKSIGIFIYKFKSVIRSINKFLDEKLEEQQGVQLDSTFSSSRLSSEADLNDTANLVEFLNAFDQAVGNLLTMVQNHPKVMSLILTNLVFNLDAILDSQSLQKVHKIILSKVSLCHLCHNPQDFELIFQILSSAYSKLIKLTTSFEEQNLVVNLTLNKFKAMKQVSSILWNVSKYFSKLHKQVQNKKKNDKILIIQQFLQFYGSYRTEYEIFNFKNVSRLEKEMGEFKQRIEKLKKQIQTE